MKKEKIDKIKRMIRKLKKEEVRIIRAIYGIDDVACALIWKQFFDLKKPYKEHVKYNLDQLVDMRDIALQQVLEEYYKTIFKKYYKDSISPKANTTNQRLLQVLELPTNASVDEIKKQFREMAKKTHPDTGGNNEDFITINEAYQELKKNLNKNSQ